MTNAQKEATPSYVAPKKFGRMKRAKEWVAANNPYPHGSIDALRWEAAFWGDQSDRFGKSSGRWLIVALVFMCVSVVFQLIALVTS